MSEHRYLVALGSNQRSSRYGAPRAVIAAAVDGIGELGTVEAISPLIETPPVGPSSRRYVNGALLLASDHAPRELLAGLQEVEARLGRERRGQRWRSRTIDLDIILWNGGSVSDVALQIPHPLFRERDFVLGPAVSVAPNWRDPVTALTVKQLYARLTRNRPAYR
ncbi:2-amino-4-hydroxy-6-hydroxymethyldihydropteridine diphosphokinase [Aurantiacibacter poecillastricola]|uniref:2-amino-4-hydroxy-6- hydroxymethyldihydropteridine diphosphokinase n=1 Tax=Aurantiacibacter poecillastricola TaxID=3064385 RepID=UPI00274026E6|nr:2-amino-4-hydroxy-6-hydroxymethyldihydropteridine diphosphokinase [Aurantiacibacter sp. 219JJ12-13]MDP5260117.1 2-amino-4-hydroxy-6-hydroxymethyldihydropteridine diphosphokinase [Aurantiacibacter sp. 219JJ12-13]